MEILFVTGNKRKVWQAEETLKPFGISVVATECEVDEIQSDDPIKIAVAKAKAAYEVLKKPLTVNDHSWSITALNGFPGGYMKDVNKWFTTDDFLALLANKKDRTGAMTEHVVYYDGVEAKHFSAEFTGKFTLEARGKGQMPGESIFIYDGSNKTIAEHIDAGEHARDMTKSAWTPFAKWYAEQ